MININKSILSNMLLIYIVIYFILAFVNIIFALLGLLCFTIPFVILYKYKKKIGVDIIAQEQICLQGFCQKYH